MNNQNNQNIQNIITGHEAIEYAEQNGLTVNKYNDPIDDAREGVTIEEALEIAKYDPSLIWIEEGDHGESRDSAGNLIPVETKNPHYTPPKGGVQFTQEEICAQKERNRRWWASQA